MNSLNRKHCNSPNKKSTSPSTKSRSRDKELQINNHNYHNESYNPEDGKLYLSLLNPSIWKGRHIEAATAAAILDKVVNILNV